MPAPRWVTADPNPPQRTPLRDFVFNPLVLMGLAVVAVGYLGWVQGASLLLMYVVLWGLTEKVRPQP